MKGLAVTAIIAFGVALTVIADIFLKKYGWGDWRYVALGALLYAAVAVPVAIAFHYTDFGKLFIVWEAASVLLGLAVASVYYKEPFTAYRAAACVLALAALYLSEK